MAVVISTEESSYFAPSNLRRSHSQPKFGTKHQGFRTSSSTSRINEIHNHPVQVVSDSAPSSAPSSPHPSLTDSTTGVSFAKKPTTSLPLQSRFDEALHLGPTQPEDAFTLPQYDDVGFLEEAEDLEPPPSPRGLGDSYTVSPNDNTTSTDTSRPDSPDFFEHAEDDTALRAQPSRHVDYLSHDWREEDIWESWKYIVSRRRDYTNSARLENASWRTWMKSKNKLKTISPETLNWLKDCDVTWLYGPLQTGNEGLIPTQHHNSANLSKNHSFVNKKPILKKRSMSEVMLQRSLSASSLLKQAAAAVQAQQKEGGGRMARPRLERAATDYMTFPFSSTGATPRSSSLVPSSASSGIITPNTEKKHIHFNEQVEQCIAVEIKGDEDDEDMDPAPYPFDSDSDDGAIMMKKTSVKKKRRPTMKRRPSSNNHGETPTIAMLPSTTLKYREDTPEPQETAMKHSYRHPMLSPSSSQETLRPSKPSKKMFLGDDDEEDEEDEDDDNDDNDDLTIGMNRRSQAGESKLSAGPSQDKSSGGLKRSTSSGSLFAEPAGMRRTESGMFMPYEEGEPAGANGGIVGRVIDTVNTARDIAHVIWNVGWRK